LKLNVHALHPELYRVASKAGSHFLVRYLLHQPGLIIAQLKTNGVGLLLETCCGKQRRHDWIAQDCLQHVHCTSESFTSPPLLLLLLLQDQPHEPRQSAGCT
jgi:hypothetical protein